ncbi:MAG: Zn-ribbon domain-containing OB-fold protein [Candidatus Odinarchaeota archaeon]
MSGYVFLYPEITDHAEQYWKGLKERKLLVQKCGKCGEVFFPPRARCPECLSNAFDWTELSGKGELYSWSEIYMPPLAFGDSFILGIIDLEERVGRIITRVEAKPEELEIGMRMEIGYVDVAENLTLCIFKPAE